MKTTLTSFLLIISLVMQNFSIDTEWITHLSPPSVGKMTYKGNLIEESFTVDAKSVTVYSYMEVGFGWHKLEIEGEKETKVTFTPGPEFTLVQACRIQTRRKQHTDYALRICGVAAPYWVTSASSKKRLSLNSRTPFSLQNALRCLASAAQQKEGYLERSNWSDTNLLDQSILIFDEYDENQEDFEKKLRQIQPNLLFIGSMTLSFPGAIELARLAKRMFGEEILVVLGGKHVNETFYKRADEIKHHKGSPLLLMQKERIEKVFDLVVAGDGEGVTRKIGGVLGRLAANGLPITKFFDHIGEIESADGEWLAGWVNTSGKIQTVSSTTPLNRSNLPIPAEVFGIDSSFPIFGTDYTAHVYSDSGKGCARNCSFCSERRDIAGGMKDASTSADRLFRQLSKVQEIGKQNRCTVSAFVEDSILLAGSPKHLSHLADLMEKSKFYMPFGGQFTVADLTNPHVQKQILRLQQHGLVYVYTGMETINQEAAAEMSKNRKKGIPWLDQNTEAIRFVSNSGINFGVSILFGIGESQAERMLHLRTIKEWQKQFRNPKVVSLNWATEHPLFNQSKHDFVDWGTNRDDLRLGLMQKVFGEASARYCFHPLPDIRELHQITDSFQTLNLPLQ